MGVGTCTIFHPNLHLQNIPDPLPSIHVYRYRYGVTCILYMYHDVCELPSIKLFSE